jgi:Fe-S-cluster containining protein
MNIYEKSEKVMQLFQTLEDEITVLKKETGIHCIADCVYCCTTSKIAATPLEFYPLAIHLYKTGLAEEVLKIVSEPENAKTCPVLRVVSSNEKRIGCSQYEYRGMICRLFAFNYNINKYGERKIATCPPIKMAQPEQVSKTNEILKSKPIGLSASGYYSQLQSIDFVEGQQLYPIGEAIKMAIEKVLTHHYYTHSEE